MELMALGRVTKIDDKTNYYAINYAALASPFLAYSTNGTNPVEINGHNLPCHNGLVRLPLSVGNAEITDSNIEPSVNLTFAHAGESYTVQAYLGSQKYTPPKAWQWSFRWSDAPPYYLPDGARASFNATPLRSVCGDCLVVWLNEAGQMLGLPVSPLSEEAEAGGVEMVQQKNYLQTVSWIYTIISHTPTGAIYATVKFCTPPLTADDVRNFCSLGSARYCYLKKSGSLMPIEVSGSFSWSVVGTGECATFSAKIYSKKVSYVNC